MSYGFRDIIRMQKNMRRFRIPEASFLLSGANEMLNTKQERFCIEFARLGDNIEAYKSAGYKVKSNNDASRAARRLLKNPEIQVRLQELTDEMRSEKIANAAEIQERLTSILRGELQEEVIVVEGVEKGVTEAKIVLKKPSHSDAIKAGQTLARMQGAFDGTINVNVNVPVIGGEDFLED